MIKFDMDGVEQLNDIDTADIDSVVLYLNVAHSWVEQEAVCSLHTIDKPWVEDEVCWDYPAIGEEWKLYPQTSNDDSFDLMQGGDIGYEPIGFSDMLAIGEWQSSNITQTMKEYLLTPENNNGIMIRSGAELQPHKFHSSESEELELRPKLVFYTHGTNTLNVNSNKSINSSLTIENSGNNCRIFITETTEYTLKIFNLLGRELYSYNGVETGWIDIPMYNLPNSVFIATLETALGKTSTTHFTTR